MEMLADLKIMDAGYLKNDAAQVFVAVNVLTDNKYNKVKVNEARALMRMELLEAFVRIAVKKYIKELEDVSKCVQTLFRECLPNISTQASHDSNKWREERLYFEPMDQAIRKHIVPLRIVYDIYSRLKPQDGRPTMSIDEWMALLGDAGMLSESHDLSLRKIRAAFMCVSVLGAATLALPSAHLPPTFLQVFEDDHRRRGQVPPRSYLPDARRLL